MVTKYASVQSMAEIGLGSVLHALHVPFGGHFLSLNQVFCLGLAAKHGLARRNAAKIALWISGIVALMKLLSPAGKKLNPMLAIFIQGTLFSAGIIVFGANAVGAAMGGLLLSIWGFIQPLALAYLLFGQTFFQAAEKLWTDLATQVGLNPTIGIELIFAVIILKAMLAASTAIFAWQASPETESRYFERADRLWKKAKKQQPIQTSGLNKNPYREAALDLCSPLFLASLTLCLLFLQEQAITFAVRTVGISYLFFLLVRIVPNETIHKKLKNHPQLYQTYLAVAPQAGDRAPGSVPR